MFVRALRTHAKLGATAVAAASSIAIAGSARSEPRVYSSGEALGRGVRLELWKAKHENVVVLDFESELIQLGITRVRNHENAGAQFIHDANAVLRAAVDLALTELPNDDEAVVTTPRGYRCAGVAFEDDVKVVGISIAKHLDVHKGLQQVLVTCLPFASQLGEIVVQPIGKGDYKIAAATLPDDLDGCDVVLLCPDLAALEQVSKAIHLLRQQGVDEEKITVVTLVTCPEAADKFCQTFSDARLVTAAFDAARDKDGCIVPGIGDFEHRYLGHEVTGVVELPEEIADAFATEESKLAKKITSWWPFGGSNK